MLRPKTLEEPPLLVTPLRRSAILVEQTEHALLGLVASAGQILQSLAASSLLAPADDTAMLVLNEVGIPGPSSQHSWQNQTYLYSI